MSRPNYGEEIRTRPVRDLHSRQDSGLLLNVIGDHVLATHPLPARGEIVVGRSPQSTVCIDDPSISRRHALIRLGPVLSIEDLGSVNGTRVGGVAVLPGAARPVAAGESIEVGAVTLVLVRAPRHPGQRPRRLSSHDAFESRLEEECARSARAQQPFAVVRLNASSESALQSALAEAVNAEHPVAMYGPGEYELLLAGAGDDEAVRLLAQLDTSLTSRGAQLHAGVALYPRDGRTPEALIDVACHRLRARREPMKSRAVSPSVVVADPVMIDLHRLAARVGAGNISVLLLGETGCGKEILAETIHRQSPRRDQPLLRLNCAALSENLLESELFGHEKGAFSGAVATKPGLFESAEGGSVFLDEVGEMPLSLQAKLLRVCEERKVTRVGGLKARPIDVRFIAATNRDLLAEAARGNFRLDLYYRLNGISLVIPPLRERPSEIEALAELFLARAASELGRAAPRLSDEARQQLKRYIWPGNIRELRNVMERALFLGADDEVTLAQLPLEKMSAGFAGERQPETNAPESVDATREQPTLRLPPSLPPSPPAASTVAAARAEEDDADAADERARIIDALEACAGNQTQAARLLGMSRGTLVARLEVYKLPRPRKR